MIVLSAFPKDNDYVGTSACLHNPKDCQGEKNAARKVCIVMLTVAFDHLLMSAKWQMCITSLCQHETLKKVANGMGRAIKHVP